MCPVCRIDHRHRISALYLGLLANGYDYHSIGSGGAAPDKPPGLAALLGAHRSAAVGLADPFFAQARQATCQAYPYWPRAALLETASFYLSPDGSAFTDFEAFAAGVRAAGNLREEERGEDFWRWIRDFPAALSRVLRAPAFARYYHWETAWIAEENRRNADDLERCARIAGHFARQDPALPSTLTLLLCPIKCARSADYHREGATLYVLCGSFSMQAAVHELLHTVLRPALDRHRDAILARGPACPGLDASYRLEDGSAGLLNAFDEWITRRLTEDVLLGRFPPSAEAYVLSAL